MQRQLSSRVFSNIFMAFPGETSRLRTVHLKKLERNMCRNLCTNCVEKDNHDALVSCGTKNSKKEACLLQHTSSCQEETDVNPVTHPKGMLARSIKGIASDKTIAPSICSYPPYFNATISLEFHNSDVRRLHRKATKRALFPIHPRHMTLKSKLESSGPHKRPARTDPTAGRPRTTRVSPVIRTARLSHQRHPLALQALGHPRRA